MWAGRRIAGPLSVWDGRSSWEQPGLPREAATNIVPGTPRLLLCLCGHDAAPCQNRGHQEQRVEVVMSTPSFRRRDFGTLAIGAIGAALTRPTHAAARQTDWTSLWNGKDFSGW